MLYQYRGPWPGGAAPDVPDVPEGGEGAWGFFTAQLMGYVDGVPQHVGETFAQAGKAGSGAHVEYGDWSKPGFLFSDRDPRIPTQPAFVHG